jgi:hypothetical protein
MKTNFRLAICCIFVTAISASFTSTGCPTKECILADCGKVDVIRTDECIDDPNPGGPCGPNEEVRCSSFFTCDGNEFTTKFYSQKGCIGTPYVNTVKPLNTCVKDGSAFRKTGNCVAGNPAPPTSPKVSSSTQAQISIMLQIFTAGVTVTSMCL